MKKRKCICSYAYMKKSISGYGFHYSLRDFMKVTLLVFTGLSLAGYLYQLKCSFILLTLAAALLALPMIVKAQYHYLYEQKRFADAITYMEQMIYMFKKKPQLLYALQETKEVLDGEIRRVCESAILYLQRGHYQDNLYQESVACIEETYGNERMRMLHHFLFQVEAEGGEYQHSMNLMLDDLKNWIQRVYEFQKERKRIKNHITISIFAALCICLFTTKIFPAEYNVSHHLLYQIMTTVMILLLIVLYTAVQCAMNGAWLVNEKMDEEKLKEEYQIAVGKQVQKPMKMKIPLLLFCVVAAIYILIWSKQYPILFVIAGFVGWIVMEPKRKERAIKRRVVREIEKSFPAWMRDLTIRLQRKPVPMAIEESLPDAPAVLKMPIEDMLVEFETDLVTIRPYQNFLKDFSLPEVHSAMKMLFTLNTAGREEMVGQFNGLVERNMKLQEKGERMQAEDKNAISGFMVVLPMVISFVKLVTDMILLVVQFLDKFSTF